MSFAPVIANLGWLIAGFAGLMLAPAAVALGYGETRDAAVFAGVAAVALFFGIGMVFATQGGERRIGRRGCFLLVALAWPVLAIIGAAPFYLLDVLSNPTDAIFESVSGLTTTGATLITGLDELGRGVVFWRAWLQWIGGFGTIIIAVSVLTMLGIGGMEVFQSAMPHGDHATVEARVLRSSAVLGWIYATFTAACAVSLWFAGMPTFDALGHALSTVSTGGFSTRDASVAAFDNANVEAVLVVFMLAAAMNFTLYWALVHGRFGVWRYDPECALLIVTAAIATLVAGLLLMHQGTLGGGDALRHGMFSAVSALTTTGFINGGTTMWPTVVPILLLALMFVGGSSGSTGGGAKLIRLILAFKHGRRELARLSHPHGVVRIRYGDRSVPESAIKALWTFFSLFLAAFVLLTVVLSMWGLDPAAALGMALATLTNAGAGLGMVVGPEAGYALLPDAAKWVLCVAMLLGRLEFVTVLALLAPMFWRR